MTEEQAFFDRIAPRWDAMRDEEPSKLRALLKRIPVKPGDCILDVGSGTGVLLPYLRELTGDAGRILAVDFSRNMLAEARKKYAGLTGISFRTADVMHDDLPRDAFDVITCLNVYPHFADRKEQFIRRMLPLLREGGCLAIFHDISRAAVAAIHQTEEETKDHLLPPAEETGRLLSSCGYRDIVTYEDDGCYFAAGHRSGVND